MAAKTIADLDLQGRRVFIRLDLNVPITPAGGISDPARVRACLPTIKHAVEKGGRVVLATHLGLPRKFGRSEESLLPIAAYLAECLGQDLVLTDEPAGDGAKKVVHDLRDGGVAMLENLNFTPAEPNNDESFSRMLASYADVYVNDALNTLHKPLASSVGMVKHIAARGTGFQLEKDLRFLGKFIGEVAQPFVVVLGGAKVAEMFGLLESLLGRADCICMGGVLANTFLSARGIPMGTSRIVQDKLPLARAFLAKAEAAQVRIVLPKDVVVAEDAKAENGTVVSVKNIPSHLGVYDLGPETLLEFASHLAHARSVLWHGPLGAVETIPFSAATTALTKAMANLMGATSLAVGEETVLSVLSAGVAQNFTHLSPAGEAALEFIEGKKLPGLVALES